MGIKNIFISFSLLLMIVSYQNCTSNTFESINSSDKEALLRESIFKRIDVEVDLTGTLEEEEPEVIKEVNVDLTGILEEEEPEVIKEVDIHLEARLAIKKRDDFIRKYGFKVDFNGKLEINKECSDNENKNKTPALESNNLRIIVTSTGSSQKICEFTNKGKILDDLTSGYIDFSSCQFKQNGSYNISVLGNGVSLMKSGDLTLSRMGRNTYLKKTGGYTSRVPLALRYARNPNTLNRPELREVCKTIASPLAIDLSHSQQGLKLTSKDEGVMFDILGRNSFPVPHTKKRIGWVKQSDYMFIVLPDGEGRVNGIDELFGDNTLGPDGNFSKHGFEALAKYDGKVEVNSLRSLASRQSGTKKKWVRIIEADKKIDKNDPVFSHLRLWSDKNLNGVATQDELITLEEAQITLIDLEFDTKYKEKDEFGNEIKYKSGVKFADDSIRAVFDIWFAYN